MKNSQILALRELSGLTQTQFSILAGMTQPNYQRLEAGRRNPTMIQLQVFRMIAYLSKTGQIDDFFKFVENNP